MNQGIGHIHPLWHPRWEMGSRSRPPPLASMLGNGESAKSTPLASMSGNGVLVKSTPFGVHVGKWDVVQVRPLWHQCQEMGRHPRPLPSVSMS